MKISLVFNGGLEFLFGKEKMEFETEKSKYLLKDLVLELKGKLDKPHFFVDTSNSVRPGILVLVNDTDYELLDGENYEIKDKDEIVFISTLHGG